MATRKQMKSIRNQITAMMMMKMAMGNFLKAPKPYVLMWEENIGNRFIAQRELQQGIADVLFGIANHSSFACCCSHPASQPVRDEISACVATFAETGIHLLFGCWLCLVKCWVIFCCVLMLNEMISFVLLLCMLSLDAEQQLK